jgi:hypothetical protein
MVFDDWHAAAWHCVRYLEEFSCWENTVERCPKRSATQGTFAGYGEDGWQGAAVLGSSLLSQDATEEHHT